MLIATSIKLTYICHLKFSKLYANIYEGGFYMLTFADIQIKDSIDNKSTNTLSGYILTDKLSY